MRMKRQLPVMVFALVATLLLQSTAMAANAAAFDVALAKAQETMRDAESKVQLWTTSDQLLKGAAKAAASGDYDLAIELANEAGLHAQLALATAAREKQTWQNNVPK
jgi:hypothetical protein